MCTGENEKSKNDFVFRPPHNNDFVIRYCVNGKRCFLALGAIITDYVPAVHNKKLCAPSCVISYSFKNYARLLGGDFVPAVHNEKLCAP